MGKRGFTLVELLAIVIILGILMAVGIPQYLRAMERSRGAEAYSTLAAIQEAEKLYNTEFDTYTCRWQTTTANNVSSAGLGVQVPGGGAPTACPNNTGSSRATGSRWNFFLKATPRLFSAVAQRTGGPCARQILVVRETGNILGGWETCVNTR